MISDQIDEERGLFTGEFQLDTEWPRIALDDTIRNLTNIHAPTNDKSPLNATNKHLRSGGVVEM